MCTSLWQTPAASTRSTTSAPLGSGSGYSRASSGFPHSMICIACMVLVPPAWSRSAQPLLHQARHHLALEAPQAVEIIDPVEQHAVDAELGHRRHAAGDHLGGADQKIAAPSRLDAEAHLLELARQEIAHLLGLHRQQIVHRRI